MRWVAEHALQGKAVLRSANVEVSDDVASQRDAMNDNSRRSLIPVQIELNGVLRRLAGAPSMELQLLAPATVADALSALEMRIPEAVERLEISVCAIGDALVARNTPLEGGEVLVVIPPVSGG